MLHNKRFYGLIIISIVLITVSVITSGCARRNVAGKTELHLASWGNDIEEKELRALVAEFESENPDIVVDLEIVPWKRMLDKLMISTAGGRPPDVTRVSSMWFAPLADKGLLEPLDEYVAKDGYDMSDFYEEAVEGWGRYGGTLYAIPTDIDIYAMYYNVDMFDRYGVDYPDWTWDWDRYVREAEKMTVDLDNDGRIDQWGCSTDVWWQSYIYQSGGSILNEARTRCTLDQPEAYRGLQFASDLINKYGVAPDTEESGLVGNRKLFTNGKIGMYVSGSWAAELVFKRDIKDFTYDVAPVPSGPGGRATFFGGAAFAITSRSQNKEAAWRLLKFVTGKKYQIDAARKRQIIPARKSVARSGAFLELDGPPSNRKVFLELIPFGRTFPQVPAMQEMREIIESELELVMLGKKSAKEAANELKPEVDQLLRQGE